MVRVEYIIIKLELKWVSEWVNGWCADSKSYTNIEFKNKTMWLGGEEIEGGL